MEIFLIAVGATFVVDSALSIYYVAKEAIPGIKINKMKAEQERLRIEAGKTVEEWYGETTDKSHDSNMVN